MNKTFHTINTSNIHQITMTHYKEHIKEHYFNHLNSLTTTTTNTNKNILAIFPIKEDNIYQHNQHSYQINMIFNNNQHIK